jgi:hypothetical protein
MVSLEIFLQTVLSKMKTHRKYSKRERHHSHFDSPVETLTISL